MSNNLNTSNSNPDWKSYTETHNTDDIIRANDFNNEFSIKVDQNGGYSLNQNLVSCSIDQNSTIRNNTTTITIADLINFYNNYSVQTGTWNPVFKINSDNTVTTSYSSQGTYKSFAGLTYYWGQITVSNIGIVTGIIDNGTMNFAETYSLTDVAQTNVTATGGNGNGASFNITSKQVYKTNNITMTTNGKNYKSGDILTIGNGGTATVTNVSLGGEITAISNDIPVIPLNEKPSNTNTTISGGSGSGVSFLLSSRSQILYLPDTVELHNAGSGYAVGDTINLINIGTITVKTVDSNGAITSITDELSTTPQTNDMSGTSITGTTSGSGTGASFTITSTANTYYYLTNVVLNNQGVGYENLDAITLSLNDVVIDNITVSSVTDVGNITGISYTLNQNYLQNDPSGNNISPTGGSGTGALFSINSIQYFTYDTISIENGGENYQIGDLLSVKQYGSYTVSGITSANGTMTISNFPNSNSDNIEVTTNVDYFDGYDGGNLYLRFENSVINFYKDQKNTVLDTTDINSSFILKFSGYY